MPLSQKQFKKRQDVFVKTYLVLFGIVCLFPLSFAKEFLIPIAGKELPMPHVVFVFFVGLLGLQALGLKVRPTKQDLILWAPIVACFVITIAFSQIRNITLSTVFSFFVRGLFFAMVLSLALRNADFEKIFKVMVFLTCLMSLNGIVEVICSENIPYEFLYEDKTQYHFMVRDHRGGILGSMGHPIVFGAWVTFFVPLVLKIKISRIWRDVALVILILGLLLAQSRTGLVSFSAGLVFLALSKWSNESWKKKLKRIVILMLIFVAVFLYLALVLGGHFRTGLSSESHRLGAFRMTYDVLYYFPWFGFGLGCLPSFYYRYHVAGMVETVLSPDNQYLRFIMEVGILGFLAFSPFIPLYIIRFKKAFQSGPMKNLVVGLGASIFSMCAAFFFFDGFYWLPTQFLFWSFLGIGLAMARTRELGGKYGK